jgi:hypothetical protein
MEHRHRCENDQIVKKKSLPKFEEFEEFEILPCRKCTAFLRKEHAEARGTTQTTCMERSCRAADAMNGLCCESFEQRGKRSILTAYKNTEAVPNRCAKTKTKLTFVFVFAKKTLPHLIDQQKRK